MGFLLRAGTMEAACGSPVAPARISWPSATLVGSRGATYTPAPQLQSPSCSARSTGLRHDKSMSTTTPKADPPVQTHASVGAKTIALRIAIVLILVLADQWSKSAVFEAISGGSMVVEGMERDIHGHDRLPVLGNFLGTP